MSNILALKEIVKKAPTKPGVYFWLDKNKKVLYVGRASVLKNRLSQYFLKNINSKTREMVSLATDLKYLVCDTLLESIVLEAKYIKQYWPKYNIVDRDNRSFLYLIIANSDYPRPLIIRGQDLRKLPQNKVRVFGPYQSRTLLENALRLIRKIFPWSTCQADSGRACFDYQIGLCPGTCLGKIKPKDYQKNIKNLELLLKGEKKKLITKLKKENPEQLRALKQLQDVSLLVKEKDLKEENLNRIETYDISHFSGKESYGSMVVFENGEAQKNEYRLFKIREAPPGDDERALREVLLRRLKHQEWPKPNLIVIDGGRPQVSFIKKEFNKNNIDILVVGISKLGGDKLVFSQGTSKEFKEIIKDLKNTLLKSREEAHRFANYGRKRGTKL